MTTDLSLGQDNQISICEKDLPQVINDNITKLSELGKKIQKTKEEAEKATQAAEIAKNTLTNVFHRKEAIENIQNSEIALAEAVVAQSEAQSLFFEQQKSMAEISKYLFGLGVANITSGRIVVRQLELKMKHASEEELSDLARQEMLNVIKQLKAQEDIQNKINTINEKLKRYERIIFDSLENQKNQDRIIKTNSDLITLQVQSVNEVKQIVIDNNKKINQNFEIDKYQNERINHLSNDLAKQDKNITQLSENSHNQGELIKINAEIIQHHEDTICCLSEKIAIHDELINKNVNTIQDYEKTIGHLSEKIALLDEVINGNAETLQQHRATIEHISEKIALHDEMIKSNVNIIQQHEKSIKQIIQNSDDQLKLITPHDERLNQLFNIVSEYNLIVSKLKNRLNAAITVAAISMTVAIASIILYII